MREQPDGQSELKVNENVIEMKNPGQFLHWIFLLIHV